MDILIYLDILGNKIVFTDKNNYETLFEIKDAGAADGIQVDEANGKIYWTDMGRYHEGEVFPKNDGAVWKADIDGKNKTLLVGNGDMYTGKQLCLDHEAQVLYFCDREGGRVLSCKTDGSNFKTLVSRGKRDSLPVDILDQCVGITLDKKRKSILWTQKGPSKGGLGAIYRCGMVTNSDDPEKRNDIEVLRDKLPEPIDLYFDTDCDTLYWTDRGKEPEGNSLNKAKLDDEGLSNHQVIATGFKETIGLERDEDNLYIADLSGALYKFSLQTGTLTKEHQTAGMITGVAVTNSKVLALK
ncbi:Piso0_001228 [Millerozyma farinosa CBS 7064]|uniref:Piso0_001228 protein n=1 Tax=Pichia sorbitophila (strain ATCC MYA-4447 / BCRC 22081 / CBS 7064 / NBRC 10061 / NRRL Y-12695) TaxID=559304 RepID=G8YDT1_PICSO|nr:Piso0_001228 [Millerozyma farinosa CBS 7064]